MGRIGTLIFGTLALAALAAPARATETREICRETAARQEQAASMPDRLLFAISLAETGRWDENRRESYAWPWSVTSGGDGQFFPTKAAAIAEVKRLKAKGVTNIDVGCMQINLGHHGEAFGNLEHAFDPAANMAYAASFLRQLFDETGDWTQAAAYYHSRHPDKGEHYKSKVVRLWNDQQKRGEPAPAAQTAFAEAAPVAAKGFIPPRGRGSRSQPLDVSIHSRHSVTSNPVASRAPEGNQVAELWKSSVVPASAQAPQSAPADAPAPARVAVQDSHLKEMDAWREAQVAGTDASHVALTQRVRKDLERRMELWGTGSGGGDRGDRFAARRQAQLAAWRLNQM